jgi:hypothetical protein
LSEGLDDRVLRGAAALVDVDLDSLEPIVGDRVRAVAAAIASTLDPLDRHEADRVRNIARRVRRTGPPLTDERVEAAFDSLIAGAFTVAVEPGIVESARLATRSAPGGAPERQVGLDPDRLPPGLAAGGPLRLVVGADNRSATARLTIPPDVLTSPLWLTVTRRADGLLLALLPMKPIAGTTTFEATITLRPPDDLDTVHIDATIDPSLAPPSAPLRALRAATARGRVAARATRLDQHDEAGLLWLACSQRWADAGDPDREAVAREWAALSLDRSGMAGDAEQLRRDAPRAPGTWAQDRARRLPATGAPFLAELMPRSGRGARS